MLSLKRLLYIVLMVVALGGIFLLYSIYESRPAGTAPRSGSAPEREFLAAVQTDGGDMPGIWLLGDPEDGVYGEIYSNVKALCASLKPRLSGEGTLDGAGEGDLVIACSPRVEEYAGPGELESFIAKGGRVILAAGLEGEDPSLLKALSVQKISPGEDCRELIFEEPLLPIQPEEARCEGGSACARIEVSDGAKVYIRDKESGAPILYTYPWGEGSVCLINGTFLKDTRYMGLLTGAVCAMLPDFLYPVLGIKTVLLDNFPADSQESDQFCKQAYGYSAEGFLRDVVWPAFQGTSLRTETPYTACVEEGGGLADAVGRSVLQFGGELVNSQEGLATFPASTAGNSLEDGGLLAIYSVLGAYGTVAHAFDVNALIAVDGAAAWDTSKRELGTFESEVLSRAPWLEGRTLSETKDDLISYSGMSYSWTRSQGSLELICGNAAKGQAFFYHTEDRIVEARGLTFEDLGNGYYLLRVQENHGLIMLEKGE